MKNVQRFESDITYAKKLVEAGWEGVTSALRGTDDVGAAPELTSAVWMWTGVGAIFGVWNASRSRSRRSGYGLAFGGLVGSALGFGCAMAWESRSLAEAAARSANCKIGTVRDARWLEKNPVAYG
jgi:hypothetical protein